MVTDVAWDKLNPRTDLYLSLKRALFDAEIMGMLSVSLLQSMILVAIYELGHAIYPAGYMFIGSCVKLGMALNLEKQCRSDPDSRTSDVEEEEEQRRVWWVIYILDRIHAGQQPTSPDARHTDLLPIDDQEWEDDIFRPTQYQAVGSPTTPNMGMLARLAQAAYLHGRVQRHRRNPTSDEQFNQQERLQIDNSLRALLNLAQQDKLVPLTTICPQTAMCFDALIELQCPDVSDMTSHINQLEKTDTRKAALELLRPITMHAYQLSSVWFRNRPFTMEHATPLLLPWTYKAAVTFMQLMSWFQLVGPGEVCGSIAEGALEDREKYIMEANHGAASMMGKLSRLGGQWCAVDAYLRILKARIAGNLVE